MKRKKDCTVLNLFIALALVLSPAGCGTDGNIGYDNADIGAVTARLNWSDGTSDSSDDLNWSSAPRTTIVAAPPAGVVTVRVIVSGTDIPDIKRDFAAAAGQGTVDNIPAGSGRTLTIVGLDAGGNMMAQGGMSNISIVGGKTTDAGTITMQPLTTPPPAPTGFAAVAASSSQINLSWNTAARATGYRIYKGASLLRSVTTTSTSDTGLSPSTNYCYSVTAYNSAGESTKTGQVCATTLATAPPVTVTGTWRVLARCIGASYDIWDFLINLNQTSGGAFSGNASATDYDGTPMQMTLSGTYNSTSRFISATSITTIAGGGGGARIDTVTTTLTSNDTGYIPTTQSGAVQGCPAEARMIKQ